MVAKKIVYLIGAGATDGELEKQGFSHNTTMQAISRNIYNLSKKRKGEYSKLVDRFNLPGYTQDVEFIISLLEGVNKKHSKFGNIATELKVLFREYIISQIPSKINPILSNCLLYIHKKYSKEIGKNGETLKGILTTNYDDLLEKAYKNIYGGLNYGIYFKSKEYTPKKDIPPLLKLHGSFNWKIKKGILGISDKFKSNKKDDFGGWIPPSIFKKLDDPTYGPIWGQARKLLVKCDILRVVGSSLRNEDIALLSLLFTSQMESKNPFSVELIIPEKKRKVQKKRKG